MLISTTIKQEIGLGVANAENTLGGLVALITRYS